MKRLAALIGICTLVCLPLPVSASPNPNLQVQIFPLECSFDTVDLGYVTSLGLTPEDCYPKPPQPQNPNDPSPSGPNSTSPRFFPGGTSPMFQFPISQGDISEGILLPKIRQPLVVDGREVEETRKDQGQSAIFIGVGILIAAGTLAALHAVYTGILAPSIAKGTLPKPRFPWSKK